MTDRNKEPNIQNIPIRTPEGRAIKEAFVKNVPFVDVDYGELEKRVLENLKEQHDDI